MARILPSGRPGPGAGTVGHADHADPGSAALPASVRGYGRAGGEGRARRRGLERSAVANCSVGAWWVRPPALPWSRVGHLGTAHGGPIRGRRGEGQYRQARAPDRLRVDRPGRAASGWRVRRRLLRLAAAGHPPGARQSAYRIVVSGPADRAGRRPLVWDTAGWPRPSRPSCPTADRRWPRTPPTGGPCRRGTRRAGPVRRRRPSTFETGLANHEWRASWIGRATSETAEPDQYTYARAESRSARRRSSGPGPMSPAISSTSSTSTGCGPARARPTAIRTHVLRDPGRDRAGACRGRPTPSGS